MRFWIGLALSLSLAGCVTAPVEAPTPTGAGTLQQHADAVAGLAGWFLSGRAAITTATESGTVTVTWRQQGERYDVLLRAPWGAGTVQLEGGEGQVRLQTSEGVREAAGKPSELLARHTGLDLPVEALRYWLVGLPAPEAPAETEVDDRGLLTELRQNGWRVRYLRYGDFGGLALPTKAFLTGENVEVRVVVQEWELSR